MPRYARVRRLYLPLRCLLKLAVLSLLSSSVLDTEVTCQAHDQSAPVHSTLEPHALHRRKQHVDTEMGLAGSQVFDFSFFQKAETNSRKVSNFPEPQSSRKFKIGRQAQGGAPDEASETESGTQGPHARQGQVPRASQTIRLQGRQEEQGTEKATVKQNGTTAAAVAELEGRRVLHSQANHGRKHKRVRVFKRWVSSSASSKAKASARDQQSPKTQTQPTSTQGRNPKVSKAEAVATSSSSPLELTPRSSRGSAGRTKKSRSGGGASMSDMAFLKRQLELLKMLQSGEIVDIEPDGITPVYPVAAQARLSAAGVSNAASAIKVPWCAKGRPYNSSTPYARFDMFGCLKVSGIHTSQTYLKTVIIIDRTDSNNTYFKLPNTTQNAYGEELTFTYKDPVYPADERALNVKSNVFCSAGQILADGSLLSIGGSSDATNADPLLNGSFAIRRFKPCLNGTCDFELIGDMTSKRWYPTAQVMPDGRVLIVGGADVYGNIAINAFGKNNPTVEYWPRKPGEENYFLQFLVDTLPFNLYPFVHVLPSGRVFIFASDSYILFDTRTNMQIPGNYPQLNATTQDQYQIPIFRSYPVSASSALFPLKSGDNYTAEIMLCGGNNAGAVLVPGDSRMTTKNGKIPGDNLCWRITPEDPNPKWTKEAMCGDYPACTIPYRRVMADCVLLVDGSLLILNGMQQGFMGLKQSYATVPMLAPSLYFTQNHTWFPPQNLPSSQVGRGYHSAALLLHDATLLISGSNPNAFLTLKGGMPTEFRLEKFVPHYLMTSAPRPEIVKSPNAITIGSMFAIYFNATQTTSAALRKRFTYSLIYPGFSTHNQRHGQRMLFLDSLATARVKGSLFVAILRAPPTANLAPPTLYWLHVLDSGVPNVEGYAVNVTLPRTG